MIARISSFLFVVSFVSFFFTRDEQCRTLREITTSHAFYDVSPDRSESLAPLSYNPTTRCAQSFWFFRVFFGLGGTVRWLTDVLYLSSTLLFFFPTTDFFPNVFLDVLITPQIRTQT
jgi:hypothetical protein